MGRRPAFVNRRPVLAEPDCAAYPSAAMDDLAKPALNRIDAAIARIERAAAAARSNHDALSRRHEQLRGEIADAIAALDAVIDRSESAESV